MKFIVIFIILFTAHLQYRLWYGSDGSIPQIKAYESRLEELKKQVEEKKQRNAALYAEVEDIRQGQDALEERARDELGMIREGETFFQVIEK
ncbi:MAG: septum formation initiator family protein [Methylovulum sp.]|nr:septum formation initiator family protein [Methylovulum sp.]